MMLKLGVAGKTPQPGLPTVWLVGRCCLSVVPGALSSLVSKFAFISLPRLNGSTTCSTLRTLGFLFLQATTSPTPIPLHLLNDIPTISINNSLYLQVKNDHKYVYGRVPRRKLFLKLYIPSERNICLVNKKF